MKSKLTKCNKCDSIYIDTNPGQQPLFDCPTDLPELEPMEDEEGYFQGCPKCKTDGYLMDVTEQPIFNEQ